MEVNVSPKPLPINVVFPPDILRQILSFTSSCYTHPSLCHPLPRTGHTITSIAHNQCRDASDPLLLSHVCSRWRNLILDTPTMWSSIFISSPTNHQLHLLEVWLERTQQCDLDILFDYCSDLGRGSFKCVIKLLAKHASHCVTFEFTSRDQIRKDMPGTFGEFIPPGSFIALKSLSVLFGTDDQFFLNDFAGTFFSPPPSPGASGLRICRITEPQGLCVIPRINPMWSQNLTSLTLFAFGGDLSILPLIADSPELVSLTLGFSICAPDPDPAHSVMVTLPKLRYLILRHIQECNFVLDWLILPHLSNLSTVDSLCDGLTAKTVWNGLQGMLERSGCSLTYLSLIHERTDMIGEAILAEQLSSRNFSQLTELELSQRGMGNTIVEALTIPCVGDESPSHGILPKLETLGLRRCVTDDGKLGRMVASRFRNVKKKKNSGTFRHIALGTRGKEDAHALDREVFWQLEKEGLTFQWIFGMS